MWGDWWAPVNTNLGAVILSSSRVSWRQFDVGFVLLIFLLFAFCFFGPRFVYINKTTCNSAWTVHYCYCIDLTRDNNLRLHLATRPLKMWVILSKPSLTAYIDTTLLLHCSRWSLHWVQAFPHDTWKETLWEKIFHVVLWLNPHDLQTNWWQKIWIIFIHEPRSISVFFITVTTEQVSALWVKKLR